MPSSYAHPVTVLHPLKQVGLPRSLKLQLDLVVHAPIFVRLPLFRLCKPAEILLLMQVSQLISASHRKQLMIYSTRLVY